MKKIILFLMFIISILTLSSCSGESYDKLAKYKSEVDSGYIAFSDKGIVINNDYKKMTYKEIFDDEVNFKSFKKVDNYVYIAGFNDYCFYLAKYDINNDTSTYNKLKLEEGRLEYHNYENGYALINYQNDDKEVAYFIDYDFNIKEQILVEDVNHFADIIVGDYAIYSVYDKTNERYVKLKSLYILKNGVFNKIDVQPDFTNHGTYTSRYIYNKYYIDCDDIASLFVNMFVYDIENNKILSGSKDADNSKESSAIVDELYNYVKTHHNNYGININEPDIPNFEDVEKNNSFDKIIKSYYSGAKVAGVTKWDNNDGNYYYIVRTSRVVIGDNPEKILEPKYIFLYNKDNNTISYVGYSIDEVSLFTLR